MTIATAHTKVDYAMVASCGVPVFDCKNVCKKYLEPREYRGAVTWRSMLVPH